MQKLRKQLLNLSFFLINNYFSNKCQLSVSDTVIYFAIDFGDVEVPWPKKEHLLANVLFSHIKCGIISFEDFYIFFTATIYLFFLEYFVLDVWVFSF